MTANGHQQQARIVKVTVTLRFLDRAGEQLGQTSHTFDVPPGATDVRPELTLIAEEPDEQPGPAADPH